ncbi:hypothetical protein EGT49_01985 [Companilactobacillus suantsaicola]|uniref:S-layer protein C-terminal domain-containing protein n=1 Tax=Companilactobacillus suantsaicola TaxID=2487723 RepID=A0A4Z0JP84_9LACO|nr:SLAP domain-containing protein [Companilactobacillus suantsaicola]TGD24905.1 hypothetical protein EGT49_01985 [Companilactobacillus suantsaicola]
MNKRVKYVGIAAATLLAVAPIAAPVMTVSAADNSADTTVNTTKKGDTETKANADDSSKITTDVNKSTNGIDSTNDETTNIDGVENKSKENTETGESTKGLYKVTVSEDGDVISGSIPAIKDGKTIEISFSTSVEGNKLFGDDELMMPTYQGYTVDKAFVSPYVERDDQNNNIIGIKLPNGIPVYTKNGTAVSSKEESNQAIAIAPVFPGGKGQQDLKNSTDITASQKVDAKKWESQMKDKIQLTKNSALLTSSDSTWTYALGTDGWFSMPASGLTPQTDLIDNENKDDFFAHFNANSDRSNLFFDSTHYRVSATVTANDGTFNRNLLFDEVNSYLQQKGGKGVTFHFGVRYVANPRNDNDNGVAFGSPWYLYFENGAKQVASKDVVVLPYNENSEENTNTNTGSSTGTTTNTNNNTNTNTKPTTDNNKNETTETNKDEHKTTPAVEHHAVYATISSTKLYTADGKLITNRQLGANSTWRVDQEKTIDGETYYRVATNEWVKEEKGLEVNVINSVIKTKNDAALYNSQGKKITNRILASNSAWITDRTATINNQLMYRVATDEWIAARDIK